jgi:hypothetical protein
MADKLGIWESKKQDFKQHDEGINLFVQLMSASGVLHLTSVTGQIPARFTYTLKAEHKLFKKVLKAIEKSNYPDIVLKFVDDENVELTKEEALDLNKSLYKTKTRLPKPYLDESLLPPCDE